MRTIQYEDRIRYNNGGLGRPGVDRSANMARATVKNGTRVVLRGIRVKGSPQTVDVKGYVSHVVKGVAMVETWGAIKRPVRVPASALTFYKGK